MRLQPLCLPRAPAARAASGANARVRERRELHARPFGHGLSKKIVGGA
jgi:hypothetical protein